MIKTCQYCHRTFMTDMNRRIFCSKDCFYQSKTHRLTKTCEICGKTFEVPQSLKERRFCSTACTGQSNTIRIKKICETCGTTFEVIPARKNARHCSKACQTTRVELICLQCGKTFYEKRSHAHYRQTCSRRCLALLKEQQGRSPIRNRPLTDIERQKIAKSVSQYHQDNPDKHPWYVDGTYVQGKMRRGPSWQQQRKAARARDNYTCQKCGITEAQLGKQLSVHHKIRYRTFATSDEANALDNLICTCQSCHMKLEHAKELSPIPVIELH